jgi:transcriptional regulator with XRE-family HTH domain
MGAYGTSVRVLPLVQRIAQLLRAATHDRGLTHSQVALRIRRDRSVISRALAGQRLPSRSAALEIAQVVGADVDEVARLWAKADALRRQGWACAATGGPPDGLATHRDFLGALRGLLAGRGMSQRDVVARDASGTLRRSTVGAVLRGERGAQRAVVLAIVEACGVRGEAATAWASAWEACSQPDLRRRHARRDNAYYWLKWRQRRAEAVAGRSIAPRVARW